MAMTTIPAQYLFLATDIPTAIANNTQVLNTTDDWLAWVFPWPGGDLTKCAFKISVATGSPVVTAQLFNVSTSDGTVDTGSAIGSAVDSATLTVNTITVSGIGQAGLAQGTYALRLIFKSGTSTTVQYATTSAITYQFPYLITVTDGGAQTRVNRDRNLQLGLGGTNWMPSHIMGMYPPTLLTSTAFADTSNPDEYGLWVTANPWPVGIRVCGVRIPNGSASRPDIRLNFYTGTLASPSVASGFPITFDRDQVNSTAAGGWNFLPFATSQTVASGAAFGIGLRAASTHNMTIPYYDFATGNEAVMDTWWGQTATLFTRENDTGALTQTTFATPIVIPMIDGIDPGTSTVYMLNE